MTEEVCQRLKAFAALAGDQSSVPSTHMRSFKTACNSSFSGFKALFWSSQESVHAYISQNKLIFKKKRQDRSQK